MINNLFFVMSDNLKLSTSECANTGKTSVMHVIAQNWPSITEMWTSGCFMGRHQIVRKRGLYVKYISYG